MLIKHLPWKISDIMLWLCMTYLVGEMSHWLGVLPMHVRGPSFRHLHPYKKLSVSKCSLACIHSSVVEGGRQRQNDHLGLLDASLTPGSVRKKIEWDTHHPPVYIKPNNTGTCTNSNINIPLKYHYTMLYKNDWGMAPSLDPSSYQDSVRESWNRID